ncbi:hypothetical protein B0A54_17531 [Friedmanniomyces endolithicus]|uniref:Kinesin light chain n=1 Tax=Friedmanniomyces endolithicus TaxID=329885 RepID=A0A4U0TXI8_9PEZI|nr:hypothetical protein B0A54_17531 [Friedmanniomyces endolithicus]
MITTRSRSEALRLVYDSETVEVLAMSKGEAEALLDSKLGQRSEDICTLALALDCMPLAITQAAAYIRERTPRCSVREYHEEIERSRASRTSLLRRHISLPSRDAQANDFVLLTWQISFEHIYTTRRSAAELLSLMSFCNRLAISESLLRVDDADGEEDPDCAADFEDDTVTLRCAASQLADMSCTLPTREGVVEQRPSDTGRVLEWATVMYRSAWYALGQGELIDELAMAPFAMEARLEELGEEDEQTLRSKAVVGWAYQSQGRWKEAEELEVKVMETRMRVLGGEHPSTLTSMANLASTYRKQGR